MESIIPDNERGRCYICGGNRTEKHHCLHGTANRKLADEDGLTVDLCRFCHTLLHDKGYYDHYLQGIAQRAWMRTYAAGKSEEEATLEFIDRYGRSYL